MQTVGWWVGYHIFPALPYNRHYNALKTYHKKFRIVGTKGVGVTVTSRISFVLETEVTIGKTEVTFSA